MSKRFDKEVFIESVKSNLKTLYRQTLVDATKQQVFQAVSYAVKDTIIDNWMETQKVYEEEDPKMVYYMSMEFLMGRALGNNMINLTEYKEVKEALEELGFDLNVIEDQEPDAALGNGGLGRLAAPPATKWISRPSRTRSWSTWGRTTSSPSPGRRHSLTSAWSSCPRRPWTWRIF